MGGRSIVGGRVAGDDVLVAPHCRVVRVIVEDDDVSQRAGALGGERLGVLVADFRNNRREHVQIIVVEERFLGEQQLAVGVV